MGGNLLFLGGGFRNTVGLLAHCGVFRQVVKKYHLEIRAVWISLNILIDVENITKYCERSVVLSWREGSPVCTSSLPVVPAFCF